VTLEDGRHVRVHSSVWQCDGKQAFTSFSLASQIATRHRSHKKDTSRKVYKCPHCGDWHIGRAQAKD
jgi:predicted RNA-binding Zn-ribbon protein involved in translation (DUF1610 family)